MAIHFVRKASRDEMKRFLYDICLDDKNLYKEVNNPQMIGIFQLNGRAARPVLESIKPTSFEEITAVNAFARPGTIDFVPQYISNRDNNTSKYSEQINEIISETHRVFLYQEQVMAVFNRIGGFSLEETNTIRGIMKKLSKKDKDPKDIEKWEKAIARFAKGALLKGITEKDIELMKEDLGKLAEYSFCKAHAVAYAYIASMNLYLSYYFRLYYYSAIVAYEVTRAKNLVESIRAIKAQGIDVLPPSINKSRAFSSPDLKNNAIRLGLQEIKGLGEIPVKQILDLRGDGYTSLFDFFFKNRSGVNKTAMLALIRIGALDELENNEYTKNRNLLMALYLKYKDLKGMKNDPVQSGKRWSTAVAFLDSSKKIWPIETTELTLVNYEKIGLGHNYFTSLFTSSRVKEVVDQVESHYYKTHNEDGQAINLHYTVRKSVCEILDKDRREEMENNLFLALVIKIHAFDDKNKKRMAFVHLEDQDGSVFSIPIFHDLYKYLLVPPTDPFPVEGSAPKAVSFEEGDMVLIRLYKETKDGQDNIMIGDGSFFKEEPEPTETDLDVTSAYKRHLASLRKRAKGFVRKITMIELNKVVKHEGRTIVPYLVENGGVYCFNEKGATEMFDIPFFDSYNGPIKEEIKRVVIATKNREDATAIEKQKKLKEAEEASLAKIKAKEAKEEKAKLKAETVTKVAAKKSPKKPKEGKNVETQIILPDEDSGQLPLPLVSEEAVVTPATTAKKTAQQENEEYL